MKTKINILGLLLLVTIAMTPGSVRSQDLSIPFDDRAFQIIEQIQDLELMGRNIQSRHEAAKQPEMSDSFSRRSLTNSTQFNREPMNRVLGYLIGTPEHESFVTVYGALIRSPGYEKAYTANLFAEYRSLIESARTRLTLELKDRLRILAIESSAQFSASRELSESDPMNIVVRQYPRGAKTVQR